MMNTGVSSAALSGLLSLMLPSLFSAEFDEDGLCFYGADNLFHRIIRNPSPNGRLPKERECTEMLCGCLINMPVFRIVLFKKMGEWVNQSVDFENLRLKLSTEQPVFGKRDDLRVEGFDDDGILKLLWTIEIKVGSGFHFSSRVENGEETKTDDLDQVNSLAEAGPEFVIQLENYDEWLSSQDHVSHRAGFVLSVWDQKDNLPNHWRKKNTWCCLTWRDIEGELRNFLQKPESPESEVLLGKNLLGFIDQSLRGGEVKNTLSLEDISLFKAFAQQGLNTKANIHKGVTTK